MVTEKKAQAIKAIRGVARNFTHPVSKEADLYRAGLKDAVAILATAGLISKDLSLIVQAAVRDEVEKAEKVVSAL